MTWFIHFCQETACLQEAQRQIDAQIITIDRQIRSVRNRLLWSDGDRTSMEDLRNWVKERYFFKSALDEFDRLKRIEKHELDE